MKLRNFFACFEKVATILTVGVAAITGSVVGCFNATNDYCIALVVIIFNVAIGFVTVLAICRVFTGSVAAMVVFFIKDFTTFAFMPVVIFIACPFVRGVMGFFVKFLTTFAFVPMGIIVCNPFVGGIVGFFIEAFTAFAFVPVGFSVA